MLIWFSVKPKKSFEETCRMENLHDGSYDWVICKCLKGLMGVRKYYRDFSPDIGDNNIFSVDFHELFLYMYYQQNDKNKFSLINYIFDPELKRDFKFTMLPPMLIELRRHYDDLNKITQNYNYPRKRKHSKAFDLLLEKADGLNLDDENVTKSEKYLELIKFWEDNINKLSNFDITALMSTNYGGIKFLEDPNSKLVNLFKKEVIRNPSKIKIISEIMPNIEPDRVTLDECFNEFRKFEKRKYTNRNNLIDAEHAALSYRINKLLNKDLFGENPNAKSNKRILEIYTGSPSTLRVFESKLDSEHFSINPAFDYKSAFDYKFVKCPIYITTRTFCNNEFKDTFVAPGEFLDASIDALLELKGSKGNFISQDLYIRDIDYSAKEILKYLRLLDIFFMNEKFGMYLEEAFKITHFYYNINNLTKMQQMLHSLTRYDDYEKIRLIKEITLDYDIKEREYDKNIECVMDMIYKNTKTAYSHYYEFLKEYDYSRLSPRMKKCYDYIMQEPENPFDRGN